MSTGTATIGTGVIGALSVTGLATIGTLELGVSGANITSGLFATTTIGATTLGTMTTATSNSTGTFVATGFAAGDTVIGSANLAFTGAYPIANFSVAAAGVARYNLYNASASSLSTITAGTINVIALRTTG
jgi:hypothetical protein